MCPSTRPALVDTCRTGLIWGRSCPTEITTARSRRPNISREETGQAQDPVRRPTAESGTGGEDHPGEADRQAHPMSSFATRTFSGAASLCRRSAAQAAPRSPGESSI